MWKGGNFERSPGSAWSQTPPRSLSSEIFGRNSCALESQLLFTQQHVWFSNVQIWHIIEDWEGIFPALTWSKAQHWNLKTRGIRRAESFFQFMDVQRPLVIITLDVMVGTTKRDRGGSCKACADETVELKQRLLNCHKATEKKYLWDCIWNRSSEHSKNYWSRFFQETETLN